MESDPLQEITLYYLTNKKHKSKILGTNNDDNKVSKADRELYGDRVLRLAKHLLDFYADKDDIYSDVKESFETFLSFTIQFLKDLDEKEKCTTINDEYIDVDEYNEEEEETLLHVVEEKEEKQINKKEKEQLKKIEEQHKIEIQIAIEEEEEKRKNIDKLQYASEDEDEDKNDLLKAARLLRSPLDGFVSVKSLPTNKKKYGKK